MKSLPYILFQKYICIFTIGNGRPMEPTLCQLYRHTLVPYRDGHVWHNRERKCAENYNKWHSKFFKTAISILVISNRNRFRVLFDKITSVYVYFTWKNIFIFYHWKWPAQGNSTVPIVSAHCRSLWVYVYTGRQWRNLVSYLCPPFSAAIL